VFLRPYFVRASASYRKIFYHLLSYEIFNHYFYNFIIRFDRFRQTRNAKSKKKLLIFAAKSVKPSKPKTAKV